MATHKELITALKFDESFKNTLRDYYSYGFKGLSNYAAEREETITNDWERLNSILADYMEWSKQKDRKKTMFASTDSQTMNHNPFHRVYRFCKYKHIIYFFHTMLAFNSESWNRNYLDRVIDKLVLKQKYTALLESAETPDQLLEIIETINITENQRKKLREAILRGTCLKTAELALYYPQSLTNNSEDNVNKTPNNRLADLEKIGLVECIQGRGRKGGKGDRYWKVSSLTMKDLIKAGTKAENAFAKHLQSAVNFYSNYYILGEVGMFILDRLDTSSLNPMRFKEEYFMQSLNDFNLIDLLGVIERKEWCRIKYRHSTADIDTEIMCFPLEIRISSTSGRQTLICYEPFRRSCTGLRLEFMDSIFCYSDKKIRQLLEKSKWKLTSEMLDKDIQNSRQLISYSWGVSTASKQIGNVVEMPKLHKVKLQIRFDPNREFFILNRILRERRSGKVSRSLHNASVIEFEVFVADVGEMKPWIRSFYSRIISCEGLDSDNYSFEHDVRAFYDAIRNDSDTKENNRSIFYRKPWDIPTPIKTVLGSGKRARDHEVIFNEVFSIYSYVLADVLVHMSSISFFNEEELEDMIENAVWHYRFRIGHQTKALLTKEVKKILFDNGFVHIINQQTGSEPKQIKRYRSVYKIQDISNFYRDVVPFTAMEIRWLKTILQDEKMNYFLSASEIEAVESLLDRQASNLDIIPMDKIRYYDRSHFPGKNIHKEAAAFILLLEGINNQRVLRIKYRTMHNRYICGNFKPVIIEFSKKNNRFHVHLVSCKDARIYTMNVLGIEKIDKTDISFNWKEAERKFNEYRKILQKSIEIEFMNTHNLADRILMEFSPWKKRCTYDEKTKLFRLEIFYQALDETDLVIRLMGYGPFIHIIDKEHSIFKEIQKRLNRQMELLQ